MSLQLKHTPGEWDGTFALALEALLTDLLSDGPIGIALTTDDGRAREGIVIGYDAGTLRFEDGGEEDVLEIEALEVP